MKISDERSDVAARLRNLAGHRAADEEMTLDALGLYRGENIEGYDTYGVMHLADLIDPTCTAPLGEHEHGWITRECSECGYTIKTGDKYCPNCGARITEMDG